MSTLIAANANITSTLTVGSVVSNQSTIAVGQNTINSYSVNANVITGLAYGGLPAASVAANNMGYSGSILQKYTVNVPQGSIAPYVETYANPITSATTTEYMNFTVVPVGNNSNFVIEFNGYVDASTNPFGEIWALFIGSTLIGCSYYYRIRSGSETYYSRIVAPYTAVGTTPFTVSLRSKVASSATLYLNRLASYTNTDKSAFIMVTENKP